MRTVSLVMIGFGNVGQAFARLILRKSNEIEARYGLSFLVTGIATGRHGIAVNSGGINLRRALELAEKGLPLNTLNEQLPPMDIYDFIYSSGAEVLFENTPVNPYNGQPSIDFLKAGLQKGMHVITANKGPVAHAYSELRELAATRGKRFLFESTVLDGAPVFSLFRACLPAVDLHGFHGILNSCTNLLLTEMERGQSFEQAVAYAQSIGIAETDPSADVDGWDAAVKVSALVNVLMGVPLKPQQVKRTGIREISPEMIAEAKSAGERWKLVCTARQANGRLLEATVEPQRIGPDSPLYSISGTSSYVQFETDVLPGLGIVENNPGPETTAFGLLADLINAIRNV
ncbi:MAG TPA: homoserine dehydrogenase [Anaerolineaceae bacterium]|nr:homoserine dehydrogenase [Anaerolineaceae bacterium]